MKIKEQDGTIVDVFGIYWFGGALSNDNFQTYFCGLRKGDGGFIAYCESEIVVVDPTINFKAIYVQRDTPGTAIYHWALIEENLHYGVFEYIPTAYMRFLEIIKSEGLVEPDFY